MNEREVMIYEIRNKYDFDSPSVLSAMLQISREEFVSKKFRNIAYKDTPVSIGFGQTMSQPYTVAFMTDLLITEPSKQKVERVLEIGTGSGYQAAVLSKLVKEVYTIEIIPELASKAGKVLKKLGFKNVFVRAGSGEYGWPEKAPFDAILITAGLEQEVPSKLFSQLNEGGVLVAPIGKGKDKVMTRFIKVSGRIKRENFGTFHFVPFVKKELN